MLLAGAVARKGVAATGRRGSRNQSAALLVLLLVLLVVGGGTFFPSAVDASATSRGAVLSRFELLEAGPQCPGSPCPGSPQARMAQCSLASPFEQFDMPEAASRCLSTSQFVLPCSRPDDVGALPSSGSLYCSLA